MTEIKTLLYQSSHYLVGRFLMMAAGFLSFPILTRIFSVGEYGTLGLVTTSLLIGDAIAKFGFPSSIVRFYQNFKSENNLSAFYSTMVLSSAAIAALTSLMFFLVARFASSGLIGIDNTYLLFIVSALIFVSCAMDISTSFLRAAQVTELYNVIIVVHRYSSLSLSILFVLFVIRGLYGFYLGQIITGTVVVSMLIYLSSRQMGLHVKSFSTKILGDSIKFGLPLVWAELGHLVLNYADRYYVQFFLGSIPLGLYTAGYNLATYVAEVIIYPINYAMTPIYMKILVDKGEEQTRQFFTSLFRYFILILSPAVFGFIGVGKDLLALLASSKYMSAYSVVPYVVVGQSIYACSIILNCGLFIRKKTYLVTLVMLAACLLNTGINVILIPRAGIVGAAQATLISYIVYTGVITYYAFREFRFRIDYGHILLYVAAGALMYLLISMMNGNSPFGNLIRKVPSGAFIYAVLILVFDKHIRESISRRLVSARND